MKNIFLLYLHRLRKSAFFIVVLCLIGASAILTPMMLALLNALFSQELGGSALVTMSDVLVMTSSLSTGSCILLVWFVPFFFAKEFRYMTLRNQVASGVSRFKMMMAAYLAAMLVMIGGLIVYEILFLSFGAMFMVPLHWEGYDVGPFVLSVSMNLFMSLVYGTFVFSCTFITRNAWGGFFMAVGIYVVFGIVESIPTSISFVSGDSYIDVLEFLPTYQSGVFQQGLTWDALFTYTYSYIDASEYYVTVTLTDRLLPLLLKTFLFDTALSIGIFYLAYLSFSKRDLR